MGVIKESGNDELTIGAIADGEFLKRSGTTITSDVAGATGPINARILNDGRLVRTSDTVLTWDGYAIGLWDGAAWVEVIPSSAPTLANDANDLDSVALTYDSNYDIYASYSSSTAFTLVAKKWTNNTTQAVVPSLWQGRYVYDSSNKGRLWLGVVRLRNATGAKFTDSVTQKFISNYYNESSNSMSAISGGNTYTYNSNVYRKANNDDATKLEFVLCKPQTINIRARHQTVGSNANTNAVTSIGLDSTSAATSPCFEALSGWNSITQSAWGFAAPLVAIGYHYVEMLERSDSNLATCTFQSWGHGGIMLEING